ncbi:ankyrin repeat-containing domain protein [Tuber brumale]|nr:ankyrin repeat-containing domain protein [Tuber brumale]
MSILSLPNELILQIAHELSPPDTNALLRTSRHLSALLPPVLLENSVCSTKYAEAALFYVAAHEDKKAVRKLLGRGILESIRGYKPLLSRAVHTQSEACIRTLIACGVDLEAKDPGGYTPFAEAVVFARLDIIKIFLGIPDVDVNSTRHCSMAPLHIIMWRGKGSEEKDQAEVLRVLLADERVEVDLVSESSWTPLSSAAYFGKAWAVRILLDDGRANVEHIDRLGRTPLHLAVGRGHDEIVKILESGGASVNTIDCRGETPLFTAAIRGRLGAVKGLLANPRIDVNAPGPGGRSPLFAAASRNFLGTVRWLLANPRIDVNASDHGGLSPLFAACLNGHVSVVKVLLEDPRTQVDCPDGDGFTPLQAASQNGYANIVRELVRDPRVKANHKNRAGFTALHMAANADYEAVVEALLGAGEMDVDSKAFSGQVCEDVSADVSQENAADSPGISSGPRGWDGGWTRVKCRKGKRWFSPY